MERKIIPAKVKGYNMKIFVTDVGHFWNCENPILERYSDYIVVVCLNGVKITDKYKCFISPYKKIGMGITDNSILDAKYQALKSVKEELFNTYSYYEKLVFLTDNEPQSLYPYLIFKDNERYNNIHLWCMTPFEFEPRRRKKEYNELLYDLSSVSSLLYVNIDKFLSKLDKKATYQDLNNFLVEYFRKILPNILYDINFNLKTDKKYYYDFNVNSYIEIDNAFKIEAANEHKIDECHSYIPFDRFEFPSHYPNTDEQTKTLVCQAIPRLNGKQICEKLKKMRKLLADANGINYEFIDCPSVGPCAGTCPQCDKELQDLQVELMKIPEEKRLYPSFDVSEEVPSAQFKVADIKKCKDDFFTMGFLRR